MALVCILQAPVLSCAFFAALKVFEGQSGDLLHVCEVRGYLWFGSFPHCEQRCWVNITLGAIVLT